MLLTVVNVGTSSKYMHIFISVISRYDVPGQTSKIEVKSLNAFMLYNHHLVIYQIQRLFKRSPLQPHHFL